MRKMRPQSTQPCSFCRARAEWKSGGLSLVKFACNPHRAELERHEAQTRDDGHMSEADRQTWGKLL
jgi:hypothetical protein